MNSMTAWWSKIGLQLRLQLLIQGFLIVILLSAQYWVVGQLETRSFKEIEERTLVMADGAINGLNTLMVTKVGDEDVISDPVARKLFIEKMGASDKVQELRVVRSKGVIDEFGAGLPQEQPADELDRSVIASGKTQFKLTQGNDGAASIRAVVPFIAMKEFRTTRCLGCHGVDEGSVLGAASITVDVKDELLALKRFNTWIWFGQVMVQIFLFLVIGLIVRRLLNQLGAEPHDAASLANSVAEGDLSVHVALKEGDSHSMMAQLKKMQERLSSVVGNVRRASEGVATASVQIAQGNSDLSARTEQQASALEQTTASMEELGEQVKQNAESARQVNQLAIEASAVAVKGGEVVAQVVEKMRSINESSHKISEITSVIDGIAFQTNILALNAAVEAARAGEQGRGFAVVATEVRSLAGRSAQAAKEIKTLISTSIERVEQGTQLVDQAGITMQEVVNSVKNVSDIMTTISSASNEQSIGVAQIGEAITQMDQVTQQNAALVEEVAAAAVSLKSQAQELVQTVAVFKLSDQDAHHSGASYAEMKLLT